MVDLNRSRRVMALALPIIGGMVSQNVLNIVDSYMVSRLGDAALAGVGQGSFANFMSLAFITGLSMGVQAMAARRLGEGREDEAAFGLNGGLVLAVAMGVPLGLTVYFLAPTLFPLIASKQEVIDTGVPYWQARLLGIVAVGMNFAFRGYWNGVNESWRYFVSLVVMHVSNIALSAVLIFGLLGAPRLGVVGAGLGSAIATWIGAGVYFAQALTAARSKGFLKGLPAIADLRTLLRLAVPAGFQQLFLATGMTFFFAIIGRVGTPELAASTVLINLLLFAMLPAMGFGMASVSLVGQALGRADAEDARRWAWDVGKLATGAICVLVLPALIAPSLMLGPFLHTPSTLAMAVGPLRLIALGLPFDALSIVLMHSLMGAGDTRRSLMVSAVTQWLISLPLTLLAGPVLGLGLSGMWAAFYLGRVGALVWFIAMWRRGKWAQVVV